MKVIFFGPDSRSLDENTRHSLMFSDIWHRSNFYLWFQYWHVYFQKMNEFRFTFANIWFWTNSKSDYYILSYDLFGSSIVKWKSDKAKRIRTDYELYGLIWVIFSETRLFLKIGHHQTILSGIFYMPITGKRGELIFWHCRQTDFIYSKNPHTCRILAIFIYIPTPDKLLFHRIDII